MTDMPIVRVNWDDAHGVLRLGRRAAAHGGGVGIRGARGEHRGALWRTIDEIAWYMAKTAGRQTHEVAQKRANGFGLFDMLGNVWEWVNDWYDPNYYQNSPSQDPPGRRAASTAFCVAGLGAAIPVTFASRTAQGRSSRRDSVNRVPLRRGSLLLDPFSLTWSYRGRQPPVERIFGVVMPGKENQRTAVVVEACRVQETKLGNFTGFQRNERVGRTCRFDSAAFRCSTGTSRSPPKGPVAATGSIQAPSTLISGFVVTAKWKFLHLSCFPLCVARFKTDEQTSAGGGPSARGPHRGTYTSAFQPRNHGLGRPHLPRQFRLRKPDAVPCFEDSFG